ncbi:MAG: 1-acyl-sn-glycerol-3-phosphate acyltransferase, partial [Deltaproteobacteria bacterium]|nr:1-acyl-sn-glycerol-3-phosphate acyltransferase [Nannocystaceae bacterium]
MAGSHARAHLRRGFARALASIWFRSRQCEGVEPSTGPTLYVLNHPNGLLDALVVSAALERPPRLLAKATLWRSLILRPFLAAFDPIPVQRRQDGEVGEGATEQMFAAVHDALARGEAIALFPEGISHGRRDLAPLKTGAARIVLSAPVAVRLIPAGLVYGERERFRHAVLLRLGPPIEHEDLRARGLEPGAVAELGTRIKAALYPLTLHGSDDELLQLAEELAWLLSDAPRTRAKLDDVRARVRLLAERLATLEPAARADIEARMLRARATLATHGIRPDQLGYRYGRDDVRRWLPGFALRLALAPFILSIGLLFWPAYRIIGTIIDRLTLDLDVVATYKFLLGLVLFPSWLALLASLAGWRWGGWGIAGTVLAAVLAFIALPLAERVREDVQAIRGFLRRSDRSLAPLLDERAQLLAAFPELAI